MFDTPIAMTPRDFYGHDEYDRWAMVRHYAGYDAEHPHGSAPATGMDDYELSQQGNGYEDATSQFGGTSIQGGQYDNGQFNPTDNPDTGGGPNAWLENDGYGNGYQGGGGDGGGGAGGGPRPGGGGNRPPTTPGGYRGVGSGYPGGMGPGGNSFGSFGSPGMGSLDNSSSFMNSMGGNSMFGGQAQQQAPTFFGKQVQAYLAPIPGANFSDDYGGRLEQSSHQYGQMLDKTWADFVGDLS